MEGKVEDVDLRMARIEGKLDLLLSHCTGTSGKRPLGASGKQPPGQQSQKHVATKPYSKTHA